MFSAVEYLGRKGYDCFTGKQTVKDFKGCSGLSDWQYEQDAARQMGLTEYPSNVKTHVPFVGKTVGTTEVGVPVREVVGRPVAR